MPKTVVEIRGRQYEWVLQPDLPEAAIEGMRADGIEVGIVENTIPVWVNELGLTRAWCAVQDMWNFRWPFGR